MTVSLYVALDVFLIAHYAENKPLDLPCPRVGPINSSHRVPRYEHSHVPTLFDCSASYGRTRGLKSTSSLDRRRAEDSPAVMMTST